jgi:hypothetical protein
MLVAAVPVLSGLRRGLPVPGLRLSELLIVVGAAIVLLAVVTWQRPVAWTSIDTFAFAYAAATAGLGAYDLHARGGGFTSDNIGQLLGPLQFLILYRALLAAMTTPERRRLALRLVLLASVPVSLLAIAQEIDVPGVRAAIVELTGVDVMRSFKYEDVPRATGPFPIWHALGGYLLPVVLLGAATILDRRAAILSRTTTITVTGLAAAALAATATIATIGGAFAGVLVLVLWIQRSWRTFAWLACGLALLLFAFSPLLASRFERQFGFDSVGSTKVPALPQDGLRWSMVPNGDFEEGSRGWAVQGPPGTGISYSTSFPEFGRQSLHIRSDRPLEENEVAGLVPAERPPVVAGNVYGWRASVRAVRGARFAARVQWFDPAGSRLGPPDYKDLGTIHRGQRRTVGWTSFLAPSRATSVEILLYAAKAGARMDFYVDGVWVGQSTGTGVRHRPALVPETLFKRYLVWTEQWIPAMSGHWLTGWGPGEPANVEWRWAETLYLTLLVRGGPLLLALYAALMFVVGRRALRLAREGRDPLRQTLARVVLVLVLLLVPLHLVGNYFVISGFPHLFWAFLGILLAAAVRPEHAGRNAKEQEE